MEDLFMYEEFWVTSQPALRKLGYELRDRYHPDWKFSGGLGFNSQPEDAQHRDKKFHSKYLDATRMSDYSFMMLKKLNLKNDKLEIEINRMLNTPPLASKPDNHCIRVHEVKILKDTAKPDERTAIMVTPLLLPYNQFRFDTVGEVVDFFQQIFEGLEFLHRNGIAHRDCTSKNILMDADANYPEPWHPIVPKFRRDWGGKAKHLTRTQRPPRYFFTNFHLSRAYDPKTIQPNEKGGLEIQEHVAEGADKTPPEYANAKHNPFATDVYLLGNMITEDFISKTIKRPKLAFISDLVNRMVAKNPDDRPSMEEVVAEFKEIVSQLKTSTLRSQFKLDANWSGHGALGYLMRRLAFTLTGKNAIPHRDRKLDIVR